MTTVGIIANPAAGKDIRRLVAYATGTDNIRKSDLVRRVVLALDATGVRQVYLMPDFYGIGLHALDGIRRKLHCRVELLDSGVEGSQDDSVRAARILAEMGARCLVTIGGDGTNRVVAKGCGQVPILPISTGTNNVFPYMVEGTTAGLAAGALATGLATPERALRRAKRINIWRGDELDDIALVDAVVVDEQFIGSKAVWDLSKVREIVATQGDPSHIGLASIGGALRPLGPDEDGGLYVRLGAGPWTVRAAVAPGVVSDVPIAEFRSLTAGERVPVRTRPCLIALDGEREVEVCAEDEIELEVSAEGPWVVRVNEALEEARERGFFVRGADLRGAE